MDYELRVLSGLHRGACLPLSIDEKLRLGAASDCDIVLLDEGLEEKQWFVWREQDNWCVAQLDHSGQPKNTEHLSWGKPEALGNVVVTICESSQTWTYVSAEQIVVPVDEPAVPTVLGQEIKSEGDDKKKPKRFKYLHQGIIVSSLVLGVVTFSISRTAKSEDEAQLALASKQLTPKVALASKAKSPPSYVVAPDGMPEPLPNSGPILSSEELSELFKKRLHDIELANNVVLDLNENQWVVRGDLNEEEQQQIERVATSFYKEHQVRIPLKLNVSSPEELLPFKIIQFNGGPLASVVLEDGARVYVGDVYKGYVLQGIEGRRVTFAGKRKVEVIW